MTMAQRQPAETAHDDGCVASLVDAAASAAMPQGDTSLSFLAELDALPPNDHERQAQAPNEEFPVAVDDLLLDEIVLLGIQEDLREPLPPSRDPKGRLGAPSLLSPPTQPLSAESALGVALLSPPPPPPASTKEPKPKAHSRVRQREEMAYLRAQVLELETELRRLKDGDGSSDEIADRVARSASRSASDAAAVWEQVAKRQMAAKYRAEVENLKLRALVEGQLRVAKSLEKLLRKRQNADVEELFVSPKRLRFSQAEAAAAQSIYDTLRLRLPSRFAELNEALASAGLTDVWCDFDDCRTNVDEEDGAIYMEMVFARVLPFGLRASADAVWRCLSAPHLALETGSYGAQAISEDDCNVQFVVDLRRRRTISAIEVDGVWRRRQGPDGVSTEMAWESVDAADGRLFGRRVIRCRQRGYVVVTPIPKRPGACIVKTVVRMWPDIDCPEDEGEGDNGAVGASSNLVRHHTVGLFVDLVIGTFNVNTNTMLQVIENALVAGAATIEMSGAT